MDNTTTTQPTNQAEQPTANEIAKAYAAGLVTIGEAERLTEEAYMAKGYSKTRQDYAEAKASGKASQTLVGRALTKYITQEMVDYTAQVLAQISDVTKRTRPAYAATVVQLLEPYGITPGKPNDDTGASAEGYRIAAGKWLLMAATIMIDQCQTPHNRKTIDRAIRDELMADYNYTYATKGLSKSKRRPLNQYIDRKVARKNKHMAAKRVTSGADVPPLDRVDCNIIARYISQILVDAGLFATGRTKGAKFEETIVVSQTTKHHWENQEIRQALRTYKYVPMLCTPLPWESIDRGGYRFGLSSGLKFIRLKDQKDIYQREYLELLRTCDLSKVYSVINAIQATAWKIDRRVLAVANWVLHTKTMSDTVDGATVYSDSFAGIEPDQIAPPTCPENPTEQQLADYKDLAKWYAEDIASGSSKRLRALNTYDLAADFADFPRLYFPHNLDFRGRVYPIGDLLTPQGDDLAKGLLCFAEPKTITKEHAQTALDWLKITGANLGAFDHVDREPYEIRKAWTDNNTELIRAIAQDPKSCTAWADADCPFQFLQFCFEYVRALDWLKTHDSLAGFSTGLVIAMDATFSGMQHFVALLKDEAVAPLVNLTDTKKKNDCYGLVAERTNKQFYTLAVAGTPDELITEPDGEQWIKKGTKTKATEWLAWACQMYGDNQKGITRSEAKRNTMTTAYGSGRYGYAEQVINLILRPAQRKHYAKTHGRTPYVFQKGQKVAADFLANLNSVSIRQTLGKEIEAMEWLKEFSKTITSNGQVITWVSPFGLPISQAYMSYTYDVIQCTVLGRSCRIYDRQATGDIDRRRQASALAPNFVHSLDASHLMFTVQSLARNSVECFAMVHDSFGVDLDNAGLLYDTIRKTFYEMYKNANWLVAFYEDLAPLASLNTGKRAHCETVYSLLDRLEGSYDVAECLRSSYMFC